MQNFGCMLRKSYIQTKFWEIARFPVVGQITEIYWYENMMKWFNLTMHVLSRSTKFCARKDSRFNGNGEKHGCLWTSLKKDYFMLIMKK